MSKIEQRDLTEIFDALTPQGKLIYEKHTRQVRVSDGWQVWIDSGPQHFCVRPVLEDEDHARWYRLMLAIAIARVVQENNQKTVWSWVKNKLIIGRN